MNSASVLFGLIVGMIIAAATGYFDKDTITSTPAGNFLWVHTFKLFLRGQLVLPMTAAWVIIIAETIGNVTARFVIFCFPQLRRIMTYIRSSDVSRL